ncbi:MAG: ABC transporter permease subunit [Deltaproteobacteria bacterium]|nr:ABC transporter permease subunit [Deltaproteobacteria bacterium]
MGGRSLGNFRAVLGKELRSYFFSPFIYLISAVFLLLSGYYFYTDLIFYVQFGFGINIMENFWQLLFTDLRLVVLLTVPFLTMRLFAEEKRLGTIELLLTYPMRDSELFWGKFCACAIATLFMLSFTLIYPLVMYSLQPFQWTIVGAGYTGLVCIALSFIACGLFISSLTDNLVVAGLAALGVSLFFWIISWNEGATNEGFLRLLAQVSMVTHFQSFAQGFIDSKEVAFFAVFITFFSFLTLRSLGARQWKGRQ